MTAKSPRSTVSPEAPAGGAYSPWYRLTTVEPEPSPDERAQALLAEVGRRLFGSLHLRHCLRTIAEVAVRYLADAVIVVGPPTQPDLPPVRLTADGVIEHGWDDRHHVRTIPGLAEILHGHPVARSRRLDPATVPGWVLPDHLTPAGDVLLVPLPGYAGVAGALLLARRADGPPFQGHDQALARVFAARAGAATAAAALQQEQGEALAAFQVNLVPPRLPHIDGVQLVGSHQPARHSVLPGGDFYDVFPATQPGAPALVLLGDVCGSGPAAAALTGKVRQTLRALHQLERHPATLLRILNDVLLQDDAEGPFVTLVVGSLRRCGDGRVELTFATGGHPAPLVLRTDGTVQEVGACGTLIGVMPQVRIGTATVQLCEGDLCLLYSDGVTEARGGPDGAEQYGEQRVRQALAGCRGMSAGGVVNHLHQGVSDWLHGGARDDIALLAVQAGDDQPR